VTLVDIAPDLLEIAAERAQRAGLTNVTTRMADAHDLPFPDATFDRLTCRLAAMYFADYPKAFGDAVRALRPGGKAVYLVWGAFDQPMFRDIIGVLFKYVAPPEDDAEAPSPFRFSESGSLSRALEAAGFVDVHEESATLPTTFPHPPEQWWEWLVDGAAPVQTWLSSLTDADRTRAVAEIHDGLRQYYDGKSVNVPIDVIVASGSKPRRAG
jgi:SAM-dependent methyltransferase